MEKMDGTSRLRRYEADFITEAENGLKVQPVFCVTVTDIGYYTKMSLCFTVEEIEMMLDKAREWRDNKGRSNQFTESAYFTGY
jgi:hypothetical protein